jgi:hypothetical protein
MNRPIGPTPPGISPPHEQRVGTQLDRHRWDAEWIAGQRLATDVVRSDAESPANETARNAPLSELLASEPGFVETRQMREPASSRIAGTPQTTAERKHSTPSARAPVRAKPELTAPAAAGARSERQVGAGSEARRSTTAGPSARPVRTHFALWRSDDAVRVAMRLRDPQSQAAGIVATLRAWLRDAGLTLSQVIVNGRSDDTPAAQAEPASRDEHSTLNTRI